MPIFVVFKSKYKDDKSVVYGLTLMGIFYALK